MPPESETSNTFPKSALPSLEAAKEQAKRLRAGLSNEGTEIGHGHALELVARQYGFRDWNTLHAAIGNKPPIVWRVGDPVSGRYLSQKIEGEILAVETVGPGWFRLTLELDEAVDVVSFESFSNFRKRLTAIVGPAGSSVEKTSDGRPHLAIDM
ncbi:glyoxalase superfamily protein [Tepidicaulis sp. LMO-SS28]|uniref:glyoxalase superfamily protein n=1 Tax=Tepidicaulis sp. LMO-SS28 TaxID=3447455 RepID=UPI003EE0C8E7